MPSDWLDISTAPRDGTPVRAAARASGPTAKFFEFPYPLTSRFLDGKWTAEFAPGEWKPYNPQPTHWQPVQPLGAVA